MNIIKAYTQRGKLNRKLKVKYWKLIRIRPELNRLGKQLIGLKCK